MGSSRKRVPYSEEDLIFNYDLEEDQNRALHLLEEFKGLIENGQGNKMSFKEKMWLHNIINQNLMTFGLTNGWQEYAPLLESADLIDFKFKEVFKTYWLDPSGEMIKDKMMLDITKTVSTGQIATYKVPIPADVKSTEIKFLDDRYYEWEVMIRKNNHSDQLLLRLAKEIRNFEKEFISGCGSFFGRNWRVSNTKKLILRSKYWYLIGKDVFAESNSMFFDIGGSQIEYTVDTHAHIGTRHFMRGIGCNEKSHFEKDFSLAEIPSMLKEIFDVANEGHIYTGIAINTRIPFFFKYDGTIYTMWLKEVEKGVEGKQIKFLQVNSFYPTTDKEELSKCSARREVASRDIIVEDFWGKKAIPVSFFVD